MTTITKQDVEAALCLNQMARLTELKGLGVQDRCEDHAALCNERDAGVGVKGNNIGYHLVQAARQIYGDDDEVVTELALHLLDHLPLPDERKAS